MDGILNTIHHIDMSDDGIAGLMIVGPWLTNRIPRRDPVLYVGILSTLYHYILDYYHGHESSRPIPVTNSPYRLLRTDFRCRLGRRESMEEYMFGASDEQQAALTARLPHHTNLARGVGKPPQHVLAVAAHLEDLADWGRWHGGLNLETDPPDPEIVRLFWLVWIRKDHYNVPVKVGL